MRQCRNGVVACLYQCHGPESAGTRRRSCRRYVLAVIRVPVPFRGSANVERVPRTFGNLLFVEASGPYSCGLIERGRVDTPVAQRARHPGSIDCSSDSAVESRIEPEGQDFLDIQEMPSFSAPSCLASLSALG
jgi:hypothetical protein